MRGSLPRIAAVARVVRRSISVPAPPSRIVVSSTHDAGARNVRRGRTFRASARPSLAKPSEYVAGVSESDLRSNPAIAAYFEANFPDHEEETLSPDNPPLDLEAVEAAKAKERAEADLLATNVRPLTVYRRDRRYEDGTRNCVRLRELGLIPGIIYGADPTKGIPYNESTKITVKTPANQIQRELNRYNRNFESRVYDLTLYDRLRDAEGGTVHRAVPTSVQRHPVKSSVVYCVNYLRYYPGRPIRIPLVYVNEEESPALKRGGFIAPVSRFLECVVEDGVPVPERLELECAGVQLKEVIRMDRIIFPEGVKPSKRVDVNKFLVGTVFGRSWDEGEEEGAGGGGGEGGGGGGGGAGESAADAK